MLWLNADTPTILRAGMVLQLTSGLTDPDAGIPHVGMSELVVITRDGHEELVDFPDFFA